MSECIGVTQRMPSLELQWARGQDKLLRMLSMLGSERLVEIREVNSSTSSQANVWQEKLSPDTRDKKKGYTWSFVTKTTLENKRWVFPLFILHSHSICSCATECLSSCKVDHCLMPPIFLCLLCLSTHTASVTVPQF